MEWYMIVLNIVIIIVILGVLISLHEAGHLATAKMFDVYCFEYSIGFGPKLLRKKRKNGETYFCLRALPIGGFVSMYGEEGAVPEGVEEPPINRSLNSIAKWKKCIVLVAGVTVNFLLGLVLIYVSDVAFPTYYVGYGGTVSYVATETESLKVDSIPMSYSDSLKAEVEAKKSSSLNADDYYLTVNTVNVSKNAYRIIDSDVHLFNADGTSYNSTSYVAVYYPETLVSDHNLGPSVQLYPVNEKLDSEITEGMKAIGVCHLPDVSSTFSFSVEGTYFEIDMRLSTSKASTETESSKAYDDAYWNHRIEAKTKVTYSSGKLAAEGANCVVLKQWNGWAGSWKKWASDVPNACGAIVKGFISLFQPGGFSNVSGVIGMTAALPQIEALGGAGYVFYFAGLLSINLAFFNLLPFPGLDGWQLVVTAVEAATKKKMSAKVSTIVSIIGFVLLFGLMIAVTIKDIIGLF